MALVGTCMVNQDKVDGLTTIRYAHSAAVTAWTPIYVAGLGVLIAIASALINAATTFYTSGRFVFDITSAVTIAQFEPVYYITATGKVTNVDPGSSGFLLGIAVEAGTATAGTVVVEIQKPVSIEHLDSGIKPSHVIKYAAAVNAGGTQATETVTVSGVSSLDIAFASIKTAGADTSAYIKTVKANDGNVAITLSTPTGSGGVLAYQVIRAVA